MHMRLESLFLKYGNSEKNVKGFNLKRIFLLIGYLFFGLPAIAQYCHPSTQNGCTTYGDQYSSFSTSGGSANINHNPGTTCFGDAGGYASFSGAGLSVTAPIGTTMGFSITNNCSYAEGYAIWV